MVRYAIMHARQIKARSKKMPPGCLSSNCVIAMGAEINLHKSIQYRGHPKKNIGMENDSKMGKTSHRENQKRAICILSKIILSCHVIPKSSISSDNRKCTGKIQWKSGQDHTSSKLVTGPRDLFDSKMCMAHEEVP